MASKPGAQKLFSAQLLKTKYDVRDTSFTMHESSNCRRLVVSTRAADLRSLSPPNSLEQFPKDLDKVQR